MSADAELRQRRIIEALLTSATAREAAEHCGMHERTIRRHLADPAFRAAYADASRHHLAHAAGAVRASASPAVARLRRALNADRDCDAIRAADVLLKIAIAVDLDDLAQRLTALEVTVHAQRHRRHGATRHPALPDADPTDGT